MFFHLLPGEKGPAEIGRMTESLIGAVGLKEFVFGTSFLSVILKDQDSSGATPSSSLSTPLCLALLSLLPLSPVAAHVPFFGPMSVSVCAWHLSLPRSLLADNRPDLFRISRRLWAEPPVHATSVFFGQIRDSLCASVSSSVH